MTAKYVTRRLARNVATCDYCGLERNRLSLYPDIGHERIVRGKVRLSVACTACLGHDRARSIRIDTWYARTAADLRAAIDHGTNDDICRYAFALGYRVRMNDNGRMETVAA